MEPYSYNLPADQIAQRPVHPPDSARLLTVCKETKNIEDNTFSDLENLLTENDILVLNNTKVQPVRLFGTIDQSDTAVELLLIRQHAPGNWICLGKPLWKLHSGTRIQFHEEVFATVLERVSSQEILVEFSREDFSTLSQIGVMPIPPYIRKGQGDDQDRVNYQTCYAEVSGSIAAPTAGLHFTPTLLNALKKKGVQVETITLHVGTASFFPVMREGNLLPPGTEEYRHDSELVERIRENREQGKNIIAVGTTTVRALESMFLAKGVEDQTYVSTSLFIQPGYEFQGIHGLITNFHQPGTTHLLLVESLLGRSSLDLAYTHALKNQYRFLSYGDAMYITPVLL